MLLPKMFHEQMRAVAVVGALALTAGVVQAQATPSLQLATRLTVTSLADDAARRQLLAALGEMLDQHPDIQQARAALQAAGYDIDTAKGERWPSFQIGTDSGSIETPRGRESYNALNAEARLNLLDAGAISAGIRSAEASEQAQLQVMHGTRQNVLLEALTALLELQRHERKAGIAAESADIVGQLARIEERRAQLGAVGRNDLRQAASRQASARAQQLAMESLRQEAQARFARYFRFTPQPQRLPALQVPGQWLPANEAQAQQAAEANSAELRELDGAIAAAQAEVDRAKAERFPTVQAVVSHAYDPEGVLSNDGTRYGVELNWNFGNGFELRDRVRKALTELQSQQSAQEGVRRQVQEAASAGYSRVRAGRARAAELASAVAEAEAAFQGRRRLHEAGRGNLSQVLDAQLDLQNLLLEQADALYDLQLAELQLARTTGQLLPFGVQGEWLAALFFTPGMPQAAPGQAVQQLASVPADGALRLRAERQLARSPGADGVQRAGWW